MGIKLIVGLGNPGNQYLRTRHNIGFWVLDKFSNYSLKMNSKFFGEIIDFSFETKKILLLKPQTFMNLSGKSVQSTVNFFKIKTDEILVIHDELDLQPGNARLKFGGSSGGHNGVRNIDQMLNDKNYWRLRIGIGHPRDQNFIEKVDKYVLNFPNKEEIQSLKFAIQNSINIFSLLVKGNFNKAINYLHSQKEK
tara:strand:- start:381 stop:962 length:582 start_codon:yes stop_codon:yes gene_type:complete